MVRLFINDTDICLLESRYKKGAIEELIGKASIFKSITDPEAFLEEVISREKKMSTGIGKGIAIAHGDYRQEDGIKIALGISREGIDFDAIDHKPVHLMFLIASPPGKWVEYLNILASIVKLMRNETFRRSLLSLNSPDHLYSLLNSNIYV